MSKRRGEVVQRLEKHSSDKSYGKFEVKYKTKKVQVQYLSEDQATILENFDHLLTPPPPTLMEGSRTFRQADPVVGRSKEVECEREKVV